LEDLGAAFPGKIQIQNDEIGARGIPGRDVIDNFNCSLSVCNDREFANNTMFDECFANKSDIAYIVLDEKDEVSLGLLHRGLVASAGA
jgi:hypothetical protein